MKTKPRDMIILASIKRNINLQARVVKSKKIYTRKQKHQNEYNVAWYLQY